MNKANTTLDVLISCLIISVTLMLIVPFQKGILNYIKQNNISKYLAFYKIQLILAESKIIEVGSQEIKIIYRNEETSIVFDRNRIVKKPGYHILIQNINGIFSLEGGCIFLNEEKIYCEKGLR